MKAKSALLDPIQVDGKSAVMSGDDTDVKATPFRGSDETIADSFHEDQVRNAYDRIQKTRRRSPNIKNDDRSTRIVPRIVVAEQWLCFLLGLICMICGVCGLFMKFNQVSPFTYVQWLGPAHPPILRCTALASFVMGAVLVRCGLAKPGPIVGLCRSKTIAIVRANLAHASNLFTFWGPFLGFGLKWKGKGHHESIIQRRCPVHEPDFTVAVETVVRLSEQPSLEWPDVHLNRQQFQLMATKNGSSRVVVLSKEAVEALKICQARRLTPIRASFLRLLYRSVR